MLTTRSDQRGLWEADRLYIDHVGSDSFYGLLASLHGQLFRDEEFADLYCPDNGRGSVEEGRDMGASPATAAVGVGVTSVGHQGSGAEYHAGQQSHGPQ